MADADIDSLLAFEENLYNLPLSQEVHYGSCVQHDIAALNNGAPAKLALIGERASSVSTSSTTASSRPERHTAVVPRKRLRTKNNSAKFCQQVVEQLKAEGSTL